MKIRRLTYMLFIFSLIVLTAACGGTDEDDASEGGSSQATISNATRITPENAAQVVEVATLGRGLLQGIDLSADDRVLGIATTDGIWLVEVESGIQRLVTAGDVNTIALSADGGLIAGELNNAQIAVWDGASGERLQTLQFESGEDSELEFSSDGSLLFVYGLTSNGECCLSAWAVESGESVLSLDGSISWALGSQAQMVVVGTNDGRVQVVDVATGEVLQNFEGHTDGVRSVDFAPDGLTVLSGSFDRTLRLWDVQSGEELRRFETETLSFDWVSISPDGRYVLSALLARRSISHVWDLATGELIGSYDNIVAEFMPDSRSLYGGTTRIQPFILDIESGNTVMVFEGEFHSVQISSDGQTAFSSSQGEGKVYQWDIAEGELTRTFEGFLFATAYFTPDGGRLLYTYNGLGVEQRTLYLWDIEQGETVREFTDGEVPGMAFVRLNTDISSDGRWLAGGGPDRQVRVWDMRTGELEVRLDAAESQGTDTVVFSPDDEQLIGTNTRGGDALTWDVGSWDGRDTYTRDAFAVTLEFRSQAVEPVFFEDGQIRVWSIVAEHVVTMPYADERPLLFTPFYVIAPDGQTVASSMTDTNDLRIWEAESGETLQTINVVGDFFGDRVTFSYDSQYVAIPLRNHNEVVIANVETGEVVQTITFEANDLNQAIWSPVNHVIALVSDTYVGLWDGLTGQTLWSMALSGGISRQVEFSANGAYFAVKNAEFYANGRGGVHVFGLD